MHFTLLYATNLLFVPFLSQNLDTGVKPPSEIFLNSRFEVKIQHQTCFFKEHEFSMKGNNVGSRIVSQRVS